VSIVGVESTVVFVVVFVVLDLRVDVVGFLVIVHILVLEKSIERRKIGSIDIHFRRGRKLLLAGNDFQNSRGLDDLACRQEPPQGIVNHIQAFMLGGMQQLEILLDGGGLRGVLS
jgi:hypothetical protein